jgi:hypothetical protein
MSHADAKPSTNGSAQHNPPMGPNGKATAAAPKLSDDDNLELASMHKNDAETTPEDDIMQLARLGDVQRMEKLFEDGKFDASYCDHEGITPLHVYFPFLVVLDGH